MIAAPRHGFVLLSIPKCASTSLEKALAPYAEPLAGKRPGKHHNVVTFGKRVEPRLRAAGFARGDYELVSMFRDPVAWLASWWRYRQRPFAARQRPGRFTGDVSFEEFAWLFVEEDRRATGIRGRPTRFLAADESGRLGIDRIFAVDRPEVWEPWFSERVGTPLDVGVVNRSPDTVAPELSSAIRSRLEAYFAPEYDVLEHLRATGEWQPPPGYRPGA